MKNPNQKLLNEFTFNMIAFLEGAKVVDKEKRVIFLDGEFYHAEIRFYLGRVAEFTVKDRKSDEILYYLHFEMTDFDTIYYHISSFIHFLQGYRPGRRLPVEKVEKKDKQQIEPLTILISCTSGMTSSTSSSALSRVACKMNYKSWNAFKEAYLEEELYLESHFHEIDANYPFNRKDSFISIESKLARLYIETIEDTVTLNGYESLYQAVDIMQKTSGINLFGLSDNLLAAQQFQTKLLRIGKMSQVAAAVFEGSYLSRTCPLDSCAIVLSYTGETSELLEDTKCLKKRGIPVIAITSVGENSLSNLADCVLRI